MSGKAKRCVICGTKSSGYSRHCFPRDKDRCREWVRVIGDEDLVHVPIEKLWKTRYVCGVHFEPSQFNKKKTRVLPFAVPHVKLIRKPLTDDQLVDFPQHVFRKKIDNDISVPSPSNSEDISHDSSQNISTRVLDHSYILPTPDNTSDVDEKETLKRQLNTSLDTAPSVKKIKRYQISQSTQTKFTRRRITQSKLVRSRSTQTKCKHKKSTKTKATQTNCTQTKCTQTKCSPLRFLTTMEP